MTAKVHHVMDEFGISIGEQGARQGRGNSWRICEGGGEGDRSSNQSTLGKTARIPARFCGPIQSESIMFHYESLNSKNIPWKFYYLRVLPANFDWAFQLLTGGGFQEFFRGHGGNNNTNSTGSILDGRAALELHVVVSWVRRQLRRHARQGRIPHLD